jgi:uncharacterized protein YkwD
MKKWVLMGVLGALGCAGTLYGSREKELSLEDHLENLSRSLARLTWDAGAPEREKRRKLVEAQLKEELYWKQQKLLEEQKKRDEEKRVLEEKRRQKELEEARKRQPIPDGQLFEELKKKFLEKNRRQNEVIEDMRFADRLEKKVHDRINIQRKLNGNLPPLEWNERLRPIARAHSEDMVRRQFFSHNAYYENNMPQGDPRKSPQRGPDWRYKQAGFLAQGMPSWWYGQSNIPLENIEQALLAKGWYTTGFSDEVIYEWAADSLDGLADTIVTGWMDSEGHKKNILSKIPRQEAIGIAIAYKTGEILATENFC